MRKPAARSPLLEAAWSAERMRQLFNERILPELHPGRRLRSARPSRMTYQPGRSCTVLYRLSAEATGPTGTPALPPLATVSFSDGEDPSESGARHYASLGGGAVGDGRPAALLLPELGALVELFPTDWRLPGLGCAADTDRMKPLLDRHAPAGGPDTAGASWSCTPLRYHPRVRCVLLYERSDEPGRRLVGKVFAKRKRAEEAWRTLGALFDASTGARRWRSPRPLHHEAETQLILMEWLPGEPLGDLLGRASDPETSVGGVRLAARALADLHGTAAGSSWEPRSLEADRAKIRRRARRVGCLDPGLAGRIDSLLDALAVRSRGPEAPRSTLLHGGASPNQLLVDGERLSIVDLDGVCRGDPALDLGAFMASLWKGRREAARDGLEALCEPFLDEYRLWSPEDAGLARRARVAQCQELVNRAARAFLKRASLPASARGGSGAERVLGRAAECLAAL